MVRIVDIRETVVPIKSEIRNAYIDFSQMTVSVVAILTDVVRDGKPVVGYGFNSNGRYAPSGLLRDRFIPRLRAADPGLLVDESSENLDPGRVWAVVMRNEKPGGHGERSVAVGVLDMAVWDAVAKIARTSPFPATRRPFSPRTLRGQSFRIRRRWLLLSRQRLVRAAE